MSKYSLLDFAVASGLRPPQAVLADPKSRSPWGTNPQLDSQVANVVGWVNEALKSKHHANMIVSLSDTFIDDALTRYARLYTALFQRFRISWGLIEKASYREVSSFMLIWRGIYLCDALQPSLHKNTSRWAVGGRGGLPSGIYTISPVHWNDKNKDVWGLIGDSRRGSILIHSGSSVKDSKGCVLVGAGSGRMTLAHSRLATGIVWSILKSILTDYSGVLSDPGLEDHRIVILRRDREWSQ